MYKKGKLKVDTKYSESNHSVSEENIVEVKVGDCTMVGYSPKNTDPQRMIFVRDLDLTNTTHLDYVFNNRGTNTYEWVEPMKEAQTQKVLWSGGWYMTAGHTATLKGKVSEQENGIKLVFSNYKNGAPVDSGWNIIDVPKKMVELHPGFGMSMTLSNSDMAKFGHKYLYIHDDKIIGHAINGTHGSISGIDYVNNYFVLRYVIGY